MSHTYLKLSADVDGKNCGQGCSWLNKHGIHAALPWSCGVFQRSVTTSGSSYFTHELLPVVATSPDGGPVLRHVGCLNSEKHFGKSDSLPEIQPCPFCGRSGASIGWHGHAPNDPGVWCVDGGCGAVGPTFRKGQDRQAVEAWNLATRLVREMQKAGE